MAMKNWPTPKEIKTKREKEKINLDWGKENYLIFEF